MPRVLLAAALALVGVGAQPLPSLRLDANATTVSGISSGAFFAVQASAPPSAPPSQNPVTILTLDGVNQRVCLE